MLRKAVFGIVGALLAVLVGLGGGYLWQLTSLPKIDGTAMVDGLNRPVEIVRDANAVPHIFAEDAHDAYFALGYVHAQDRLWQMEFTRRLGAGRLAEVLGESALNFDRFFRTLGIYRLAEANYERLSPTVRRMLDAYVAGVNAWMKTRDGALPLEFLLLGIEPEPWRPADSLVWGRLMAIRLGRNWRTELLRAGIQNRLADMDLPSELLDQLWPASTRVTPSTIESVRHAGLYSDALLKSIPTEEVLGGSSNAWVVDGTLTSTGKPILANDPHLSFGAPVIWYLARIEAPGMNLTGVTFPGTPLTVLGHNGHIAWGFTNGYGDNEDLFEESVDPANPEAYLTPIGSQEFVTRQEVIKIKDGDFIRLTVRKTRHGPVISDVSQDAAEIARANHVIAFASPALRADDRTFEAIYAINRARNWKEFFAAAADFHTPHQNLMLAAIDGDIGFVAAGRIPIRKSGDGRLPVSGKDGIQDWQKFVPPGSVPYTLNPSSGRIVNANNRSIPMEYPYLITHDWPPPFRAERILEVLDQSDVHDMEGMASLQCDFHSAAAQRLLPLMLNFEPSGERTREAHDLLARWDYSMQRDRAEPLIYTAWLRQFIVALIDDELGQELVDGYLELRAYPGLSLAEAALTRDPHWCDDINTGDQENCQVQLALALQRALDEITDELNPDMETWRWGDLHRATFTNRVLTRVPIIKWFADLSIESDGGDHTVNRGTTPRARPGNSFRHLDGSGFRAIYDLADLGKSRFIIATGQSGNFLSSHYRDLLKRWRDGEYIRITQSRASLDDVAIGKLLLQPVTR